MIPKYNHTQSSVISFVGGPNTVGTLNCAIFLGLLDGSRQMVWLGEVALWFSGRTTPSFILCLLIFPPITQWHCRGTGAPVLCENLTHCAVTQLLKILIAGICIQGRRRSLFVQPTYETSHIVCNHPPAFTVRGSLSLLETVIAKMTFILTESSRLLHSDSWNEPRYWVTACCSIICISIVLCNS